MMAKRRAFTLSASQYMQQVRLPPEFLDRSRSLANNLLKDAVYRYHALRHEHKGRPDPKMWKPVKEKNLIHCFKSKSSSNLEILAIGIIPGLLEDVLHGVLNLTPEAMHIENALAESDLSDSRVLAFPSPPTPEDPFESMTVKWVVRKHAGLPKQRDYVYLECTGTTIAPDGEELGFLLAHSVTLAAVPEFRKDSPISRGQLSYCYLYRDRAQLGVEVFFKGLLNPQCGVKERVPIGLTVDMVTNGCPASVQLAMMKKLMFCLRTLPPPGNHSRSSQSSSNSNGSANSALAGRSRSVGSNGSFLRRLTTFSTGSAGSVEDTRPGSFLRRSQSSSTLDAHDAHAKACEKCNRHFNALKSKGKCQLCYKIVCSRCRIVQRVIAFNDNVMYPEKLDFCLDCVTNTTNTSAAWIAAQELHDLDHLLEQNLAENDQLRANTLTNASGNVDASKTRKPVWEVHSASEDRQTLGSEFSTRSSTSSRYMMSLTQAGGNGSIVEDPRVSRLTVDLEDMGLADVDEEFSSSGLSHQFVVHGEDDDEDEMPMVDSFVDDDFFFDDADEIFLSVAEVDEEKEELDV